VIYVNGVPMASQIELRDLRNATFVWNDSAIFHGFVGIAGGMGIARISPL
jgi:hypothetical protein